MRRIGLAASTRACADEADGIPIPSRRQSCRTIREIDHAYGTLGTSMKTLGACAGALAEACSILITLQNELNSFAGGAATLAGDAVW